MQKNFWKFQNQVEGNGQELVLSGPIASETWWGDEVTPQLFREELKKVSGSKLTVILNSGGGDVFAGLEIYNALREHDSEITVRVDGLAASIASIIAMAGEKIVMSPGSLMMIHRPSTFAMGNVDELDKAKEILLKIEESIIPIYAERTGLSHEEISDLLENETWFTAQEAIEKGFADEAITSDNAGIKETIQNALNGDFSYSMEATKQSLASLAAKMLTAEEQKTKDVTEGNTEDTTTVKVEEVPEVEAEVTETIEEEIINNNEEQMTEEVQKVVASTQVVEPQAQPDPEVARPNMKDYLASKASMEAFANVLQANAGKTSEEVRMAWKNHLEVTMGVTNPEIFLPTALITEIEDAFQRGGEIWSRVTKTGVDVFKAAWDAQTDVSAEAGRAKGYVRAEEDEKQEQVLSFLDRVLRPQFIYKYIVLNKEDIKNQRSTGALVRYVLTELPRRIVRELERAIVIGDGRGGSDQHKISSFVAVKADAAAGNAFASRYTPIAGESRYSAILNAKDLILAEGTQILVAKKGYLTSLLLEQNINGGFLFAPGTNLAQMLGFAAVVEPDWLNDTTDTDNDAYIIVLSNYKTVGDDSIEAFTNFTLKTNQQEYLQEIWAGGALTIRKSAVAIAETPAS